VTGVGVELPMNGPIDPSLRRRLTEALAQAVELKQDFTSDLRLPVHPSSTLRRDEAVGNAASGFNTASAALVGSLDHLLTWYQVVAGDLDRFALMCDVSRQS
jgi:hypothetical protein